MSEFVRRLLQLPGMLYNMLLSEEAEAIALSAFGIVVLIVSLCLMMRPSANWRTRYSATVPKALVFLPKAGRYTAHARLARPSIPRVPACFHITKANTGEVVQYDFAYRKLAAQKREASTSLQACHFRAPGPGEYLVEVQPGNGFEPGDEIVIERYQSAVFQVSLVFGVVAGLLVGAGVLVRILQYLIVIVLMWFFGEATTASENFLDFIAVYASPPCGFPH